MQENVLVVARYRAQVAQLEEDIQQLDPGALMPGPTSNARLQYGNQNQHRPHNSSTDALHDHDNDATMRDAMPLPDGI